MRAAKEAEAREIEEAKMQEERVEVIVLRGVVGCASEARILHASIHE